MRLLFYKTLLLGPALLITAGCLPSQQAPANADFRAPDAASRVPALVGAADQDDADTLAELVHALSDDDAAVRLFAIQSLQSRTGESFGYRYYDAGDKRQAAANRWHDWLTRKFPDADAPADNNP